MKKNAPVHVNVAVMHKFRQVDGIWQRCLRSQPTRESNWKTLQVEHTGEQVVIDKTGRKWMKQQSNKWTWV